MHASPPLHSGTAARRDGVCDRLKFKRKVNYPLAHGLREATCALSSYKPDLLLNQNSLIGGFLIVLLRVRFVELARSSYKEATYEVIKSFPKFFHTDHFGIFNYLLYHRCK